MEVVVVVAVVGVIVTVVVVPSVVEVVPGVPLVVVTDVDAGVVVEVEVDVAASPLEQAAAASDKRTAIARLLPAIFLIGVGNGIPARLPAVQFRQGSYALRSRPPIYEAHGGHG